MYLNNWLINFGIITKAVFNMNDIIKKLNIQYKNIFLQSCVNILFTKTGRWDDSVIIRQQTHSVQQSRFPVILGKR